MNNYTEPPFSGLFSELPSSLKYLDVSPDAVKLKFSFSQFFFLISTFCYLLLNYTSQSASLNFIGDVYE